jgi:hypothetical protein
MGVFLVSCMPDINITRRMLLAALLSSSTATLASRYWVSAAAAESTVRLELPEPETSGVPSFPVFLALSQLVTLRPQLDEAVARRMYPLFLDEPWGAHHIISTYSQLRNVLQQPADNPNQTHPAAHGGLGKGQIWFASHLLTTWYLGVYYHERMAPLRVAYAEALMFAVVHPGLPVRFIENTGYGKWQGVPPGRNQ